MISSSKTPKFALLERYATSNRSKLVYSTLLQCIEVMLNRGSPAGLKMQKPMISSSEEFPTIFMVECNRSVSNKALIPHKARLMTDRMCLGILLELFLISTAYDPTSGSIAMIPTTVVSVFLVTLLASEAHGHGAMVLPPQRGVTNGFVLGNIPKYARDDVKDVYPHFPAGNKSDIPGAALTSQKKAAGSRGWSLYEPTRSGFKFRSGPCGDLIHQIPGEHR
eukprot:IDg1300t1